MSDYLTVTAQATKFKETRVSDNVRELLSEPDPDVEVVLFHGLQREGWDPEHAFWRTWKMRNSEECWPEKLLPTLLKDTKVQYRARVLSVSYESRPDPGKDGKGTDASDEFLIVECLISELIIQAKVGQRSGVPVFLVGHDLGGILIKEFVMKVEDQSATMSDEGDRAKMNNFLEKLKSVFFYATPHYGSQAIEAMAAKIDAKDANQMLRLMKVLNKHTGRINSAFQIYRSDISQVSGSHRPRFTTYAMHATHLTKEGDFKDVPVCAEGSTRSDIDVFYPAKANHFEICQPEGKHTTEVMVLANHMKKCIQDMQMKERWSDNSSANGSAQNERVRGRT